jgi:hypothetical protein
MTANSPSLFAPANMSAGGFLNNLDAVIVGAKFGNHADTPFDPLGKDDEDSTYLIVSFLPDEAEDDVAKDEYYRLGPVSKVTPSTDGQKAIFQEGARLNKSTKAGLFFAALVNAGFPVSSLPADNSCGFLKDLHVHLDAVPMDIKDDGKGKFKGKGDSTKTPSVTLITKLLEPKKAGAKKTTGGSKPAPTSAPAAAAAPSDADGQVQAAIVDLIMANGGTEKRLLPTLLMKSSLEKDAKTAAFKVVGKDEWLAAGPWDYNAGSGSLSMNDATAEHLAARG